MEARDADPEQRSPRARETRTPHRLRQGLRRAAGRTPGGARRPSVAARLRRRHARPRRTSSEPRAGIGAPRDPIPARRALVRRLRSRPGTRGCPASVRGPCRCSSRPCATARRPGPRGRASAAARAGGARAGRSGGTMRSPSATRDVPRPGPLAARERCIHSRWMPKSVAGTMCARYSMSSPRSSAAASSETSWYGPSPAEEHGALRARHCGDRVDLHRPERAYDLRDGRGRPAVEQLGGDREPACVRQGELDHRRTLSRPTTRRSRLSARSNASSRVADARTPSSRWKALDDELAGAPLRLEVCSTDDPVTPQERQHVVAESPHGCRLVDLDQVVEPEGPARERPVPEEVVEGERSTAAVGAGCGPAPRPAARSTGAPPSSTARRSREPSSTSPSTTERTRAAPPLSRQCSTTPVSVSTPRGRAPPGASSSRSRSVSAGAGTSRIDRGRTRSGRS